MHICFIYVYIYIYMYISIYVYVCKYIYTHNYKCKHSYRGLSPRSGVLIVCASCAVPCQIKTFPCTYFDGHCRS